MIIMIDGKKMYELFRDVRKIVCLILYYTVYHAVAMMGDFQEIERCL